MSGENAGAEAPPAFPDNFDSVIQHNEAQIAREQAAEQQAPVKGRQPQPDEGGDDDLWSDDPGAQAAADPEELDADADAEAEVDEDPEGKDKDDEPEEEDEPEESEPEEEEEEIHGVKASELMEAIKKGELPSELLKELKVIAKVNGEDLPISVEEAARGYQRLSDYTRMKREAGKIKREAQGTVDNVQRMFEGWAKDHRSLRDGLKRIPGLWTSFHNLAEDYAKEQYQELQLKEQNPELYEIRKQLREEREAREALEARLNKPASDNSTEERAEEFARQLKPLISEEFSRLSIKDSPFARSAFREAFSELYDPDAELSEVVRDAAQATAELLAEKLGKADAGDDAPTNGAAKKKPAAKAQKPAKAQQPAGAKRSGAAPAPAKSRRTVPQRMTIDDFDAWSQKNPRMR